jgi:hypothetical protein
VSELSDISADDDSFGACERKPSLPDWTDKARTYCVVRFVVRSEARGSKPSEGSRRFYGLPTKRQRKRETRAGNKERIVRGRRRGLVSVATKYR